MEMIECFQQSGHMRQPSKNNHNMQYLMTASKHIVFLWVPSFRNLNIFSEHESRQTLQGSALTLAA